MWLLKMHPRNRHRGRYDFDQLIQTGPAGGEEAFVSRMINESAQCHLDVSQRKSAERLAQQP